MENEDYFCILIETEETLFLFREKNIRSKNNKAFLTIEEF